MAVGATLMVGELSVTVEVGLALELRVEAAAVQREMAAVMEATLHWYRKRRGDQWCNRLCFQRNGQPQWLRMCLAEGKRGAEKLCHKRPPPQRSQYGRGR